MTDIDLSDIKDSILNTVLEMFDKVFGILVIAFDTEMPEIPNGERMAVAAHCAGDLMGSFVLTMNGAFATRLADRMPEIEGPETKVAKALYAGCDHVCDGLGIHLKNLGLVCDLSSPFIVVGSDFKTAPLAMEKTELFSFRYEEQVILIELGLKLLDQQGKGAKEKPAGAKIPASGEEPNVRACLENAIPTMFERMFSIKNVRPTVAPESAGGQMMAGSVCLAGALTGCVHLFVTEDFAKLMTAAMFDITPNEIENINEVLTVIGQACMIIARNLKKHLNSIGHMPELTAPLVTIGKDFSMNQGRMTRCETLAFTQDGNAISVVVGLNVPGEQPVLDDIPKSVPEEPEGVGRKSVPKETPASDIRDRRGSDFILDIPLDVTVELGRAQKRIKELLEVSEGTVIVLSELENDPVDVLVNDVLVARGEVVVENGKYGVRITEVKSRFDRTKRKNSSLLP